MEHTCILISSGDLRLSNRCKQFVHPACFVLVLSILEFPCNQFMNQAPGNDEKSIRSVKDDLDQQMLLKNSKMRLKKP